MRNKNERTFCIYFRESFLSVTDAGLQKVYILQCCDQDFEIKAHKQRRQDKQQVLGRVRGYPLDDIGLLFVKLL